MMSILFVVTGINLCRKAYLPEGVDVAVTTPTRKGDSCALAEVLCLLPASDFSILSAELLFFPVSRGLQD